MKNTIESLPLQLLWQNKDTELQEQIVLEQGWANMEAWLLPQALAHWGRWRLTLDEDGFVDVTATLKQNLTTDWHLGLWTLATQVKRGLFVRTQRKPESAGYSVLVPLILAAIKRDQNVEYTRWPLQGLHRAIHEPLWEVLSWAGTAAGQACRDLGSDELIRLREQGLTTRSGKTAGKTKDPLATWCLTGMQGTPLDKAPKLATTMLAQIWVAHPQLRTGYMILDPWNWDRMPASLWSEQLFDPIDTSTVATKSNFWDPNKLPWE